MQLAIALMHLAILQELLCQVFGVGRVVARHFGLDARAGPVLLPVGKRRFGLRPHRLGQLLYCVGEDAFRGDPGRLNRDRGALGGVVTRNCRREVDLGHLAVTFKNLRHLVLTTLATKSRTRSIVAH